ncbi:MAG: hypothetical protein AABW73_04230 [Nanoarchaeota archaeon]
MADIKKVALTLAVGILLALFVGFLVDAIYSSPKYEDFCTNNNYPIAYEKTVNRELVSGCPNITVSATDEKSCYDSKGYITFNYTSSCPSSYYCETCQVELESANQDYSRNLFFILAPISIALIAAGLFLSLESIGSGFILGGILILIYGTIRVFGDLSKVMRVILLGVELVLVIWLGYRRVEKSSKKKK